MNAADPDCLIVCTDGCLPAHRILLRIHSVYCDTYFKNVVAGNFDDSDVEIVLDTQIEAMQIVLDYMYNMSFGAIAHSLEQYCAAAELCDTYMFDAIRAALERRMRYMFPEEYEELDVSINGVRVEDIPEDTWVPIDGSMVHTVGRIAISEGQRKAVLDCAPVGGWQHILFVHAVIVRYRAGDARKSYRDTSRQYSVEGGQRKAMSCAKMLMLKYSDDAVGGELVLDARIITRSSELEGAVGGELVSDARIATRSSEPEGVEILCSWPRAKRTEWRLHWVEHGVSYSITPPTSGTMHCIMVPVARQN